MPLIQVKGFLNLNNTRSTSIPIITVVSPEKVDGKCAIDPPFIHKKYLIMKKVYLHDFETDDVKTVSNKLHTASAQIE